jgi:probable phosphoglycerate mutase
MSENQPPPGAGESPVDRFDADGGVPQRRFRAPQGSTTVLLVRHGATEAAHPERPFTTVDGHGDPSLAVEGVEQARRVCDRLAGEHSADPITAIYVTNLRRTSETVAPLAGALGLTPVVEPDLREVHLGDYEGGLLRLKGAQGDPVVRRVYEEERWDVIPGAEPWESFQRRCTAALERIAAAEAGGRVVAVVHGGVITALLSHVARSRNFAFVSADNASISEVVLLGPPIERWVLRRFNDCTHLD